MAVTSQAQKLGLRPGQRVAIEAAPDGWELEDPPPITLIGSRGAADVVLAFFDDPRTMARRVPTLARRIHPAGALWIAWPRRAGGHQSEITSELVRATVLELGLVDVKVAALDPDWSAHKALWRLENRG
jgi:hypothetical protein